MELKKTHHIDENFIGTFNNFFPKEVIQDHINHFNNCEKENNVFGRGKTFHKKDLSIVATSTPDRNNLCYIGPEKTNTFKTIFFETIYPIYREKFPILDNLGFHTIHDFKIQKTNPTEGYHVWHCENDCYAQSNRVLVFTLYLNTIEEGGETEFLYQKCRVKPVENKFVLWPSGFTHTHRGNPPLKETKYITTGWVEFGGS